MTKVDTQLFKRVQYSCNTRLRVFGSEFFTRNFAPQLCPSIFILVDLEPGTCAGTAASWRPPTPTPAPAARCDCE